MSIYVVNTWSISTYEARRSLIFNYINPLIRNMKLEDVTLRIMDKYFQSLLKVKAKVVNNCKPTHEYLTAHTVKENIKSVMFKFLSAIASTHTALVLKELKTKTGIGKIFPSKTVTEMLVIFPHHRR